MKPVSTDQERYSLVAIVMHWLIALLFLSMIVAGYTMTSLSEDDLNLKFSLYQWHKSFGITILLLTLLRLGWRLSNSPPKMPKTRVHQTAKLMHGLLYGLTLLIPLAGWALVSASPFNIPTILFGEFNWPHLPYFSTLPDKQSMEASLKLVHKGLAYGTGALVMGHITAALYHHFLLKDQTLAKMMPKKRENRVKL
jgi:cytochrome b561